MGCNLSRQNRGRGSRVRGAENAGYRLRPLPSLRECKPMATVRGLRSGRNPPEKGLRRLVPAATVAPLYGTGTASLLVARILPWLLTSPVGTLRATLGRAIRNVARKGVA